jgi:tetratricopeptide (TPR) repeat protein
VEARSNFLFRVLRNCLASAVLLLGSAASAQSPATLDVNETLFSVFAGINACGYDQELQSSSSIRAEVRSELKEAGKSAVAADAGQEMCRFYARHRLPDQAEDLAHYVSLALNLGPAPDFQPRASEADLPPDAAYVSGFAPLLKSYYVAAKLHSVWQQHQAEYQALIDEHHETLAQMIRSTDNYLRLPMSGFEGRSFTVYLEPMGAPSQVNSRNYGDAYYVVVSPVGGDLHADAMRHTYLHFVLDPLTHRRATALDRLRPILYSVEQAPMPDQYKRDVGLLLVESLIRAIEARTSDPKMSEKDRLALVQKDEAQGYVFTGYFYERLREFEKADSGLETAFPNWLREIDVQRQAKHAGNITFATEALPEVLATTTRSTPAPKTIDLAEQALDSGNAREAGTLAQQSLAAKQDQSRAYFVLAKVASLNGQMQEARTNFEKALQNATEPHVIAWSNIYLGRILDIQQERDGAISHYRAALATSNVPADAKSAAERGLQQPYQPPENKPQAPSKGKAQ